MSALITFLRKPHNWPMILIPLGLMVWAKFGAPALARKSYNSLVYFDSPYEAALPAGEADEAIAEQVVIVVVDGLRVDASQQMPTLNRLRAQGAERVAVVGQPSLSRPGWTVIGTGAWQEQSGITTNFTDEAIALDTLFLAAKRKGLTTGLMGSSWWHELYLTGVDDYGTAIYSDEAAVLGGLEALKAKSNLVLIHVLDPDFYAHEYGGVSAEYLKAVQTADSQLARILATLDLNTAALFVTADHGHLDQGGHGGWEPIVLRVPLVSVGKGIRPGTYPDAFQVDIAPTVAAILGTSIPAHNQGDILFDQLDAAPALKAARAVDLAQQLITRHQAMLPTLGETSELNHETLNRAAAALQADDYAEALTLAEQSNTQVRAEWAAARQRRINRDRLARLPLALMALLPVALYLLWWKQARWNWAIPLAGAMEYFVIWNALYFGVQKHTYSFSMFNSEAASLPLLGGAIGGALAALLAAMVVVGLLRRQAGAGEIAREAINTLFLIGLALAAQLLIFYVAWDVTFSLYLPNLHWGFKFFLEILQTLVFWPTAAFPVTILLPLVALLAARVANWVTRLSLGAPRLAK